MRINKFKLTSQRLQEKEHGVAKRIPYAHHADKGVIVTKSGDLITTIQMDGIPHQSSTDNFLNQEKHRRANLFKDISEGPYALQHTIIRRKISPELNNHYDNAIAKSIAEHYQQGLRDNELFENQLFLSVIRRDFSSRGNTFVRETKQRLKQLTHQTFKDKKIQQQDKFINELDELTTRLTSALSHYGATRLTTKKSHWGLYSEHIHFLSQLINWDVKPKPFILGDLSTQLTERRIFFSNNGWIEWRGRNQDDTRYGAIISLKMYPELSYAGILDHVLSAPVEMIVSQSFVLSHQQKTREAIQLQLKRLINANDPDLPGIETLQDMLSELAGKRIAFGDHHLTVMVVSESIEMLKSDINRVLQHCDDVGISTVIEDLNAEPAFWSQLPGNLHYVARKLPINTRNFASYCSLHRDSIGFKQGNHWGEAVTTLKTASGMPYFFNFHEYGTDKGHTLIVGESGSGKTFLINFLIAMSMKYGTRVFYFDKDRGAEIMMRALGATHITIGNGQSNGFNPLQLGDTENNRSFLNLWFQMLFTATGSNLSDEQLNQISHAVRQNFDVLSNSERTLEHLGLWFGPNASNNLGERLSAWYGRGMFNEYFGSHQDTFSLDGQCYHFEMGDMLQNQQSNMKSHAVPATLAYLFHRIELLLATETFDDDFKKPTLLVIDEAWLFLKNPLFASRIENWLRSMRKKNVVVCLLTQTTEELADSTLGQVIVNSTHNKIVFPSASLDIESAANILQFGERERALMSEFKNNHERYFLIKKSNECTIAQLEGSSLKEWLPLFSTKGTIDIMNRAIKQYGSDPCAWVKPFCQLAQELHYAK